MKLMIDGTRIILLQVNGNVVLSGTIDTGQGATEVYLNEPKC